MDGRAVEGILLLAVEDRQARPHFRPVLEVGGHRDEEHSLAQLAVHSHGVRAPVTHVAGRADLRWRQVGAALLVLGVVIALGKELAREEPLHPWRRKIAQPRVAYAQPAVEQDLVAQPAELLEGAEAAVDRSAAVAVRRGSWQQHALVVGVALRLHQHGECRLPHPMLHVLAVAVAHTRSGSGSLAIHPPALPVEQRRARREGERPHERRVEGVISAEVATSVLVEPREED